MKKYLQQPLELPWRLEPLPFYRKLRRQKE